MFRKLNCPVTRLKLASPSQLEAAGSDAFFANKCLITGNFIETGTIIQRRGGKVLVKRNLLARKACVESNDGPVLKVI